MTTLREPRGDLTARQLRALHNVNRGQTMYSDNVILIADRRRIHANCAQSDNEIADAKIRAALPGYPTTIVAQAIARVHRLIRAGKCVSLAVDQVLSWARGARHDSGDGEAA